MRECLEADVSRLSVGKKRKSTVSKSRGYSSVLSRVGCNLVSYDFTVPLSSFDREGFSRAIGLSNNENRWNRIYNPKDHAKHHYHVHFEGSFSVDEVDFTVDYYQHVGDPRPGGGPSSETIMRWLGQFFRVTHWRGALLYARFEKSHRKWKSRFNLPFKVTLSGSDLEVAIEGISLSAPSKNRYKVVHGWLDRHPKHLSVSVLIDRDVDFQRFTIQDEVAACNEAIKLFVEELS
jgi:hypothetical protein